MNNTNESRPDSPAVRQDPLAGSARSKSAKPQLHPTQPAPAPYRPEASQPSPMQHPHAPKTQSRIPQPASQPSRHAQPQPPQKNPSVLPFVLIGILSVMVVFMGAVTFLSLFRLNQMSEKLLLLQDSMDDIEADLVEVSTQAETLTALNEQYEALAAADSVSGEGELQGPLLSSGSEQTSAPQTQAVSPSEEQGTLSPSSDTVSALDDPSYDAFLYETVIPTVQDKLPSNNGKWSVYISNLALDSSDSINNSQMKAASLIKLFIMGAVYERYDQLIGTYGESDVYTHLYQMITVSDNDSANTLVTWLGNGDAAGGRSVVNDFCNRQGFTGTVMGRMLLEENPSGENYTCVKDCGEFLREVYYVSSGKSSPTHLTHCDEMFNLLKQQQRRNKIPLRIPDGVGVANKTGELADVENDAAIIYNTEKGIDLVIVFMSENLTDCGSAQQTISNLSNTIYGAYNNELV